jgi:hypothetical protein
MRKPQMIDFTTDNYFSDGTHVYFVPANWPQETDDEDGQQVLGYAPLYTVPDSEIAPLWIRVSLLERMAAVGEADARAIHPAMFAELARIDAEVSR